MNTDTGTIILVLLVGISALTDLWKGGSTMLLLSPDSCWVWL